MVTQFTEGRQDHELARSREHRLVLEVPGVHMRDIHRVQTRLHRGIDITAGAVADHPAVSFYNLMFIDEQDIGSGIFFSDNFNGFEKALQSRAFHLGSLFGRLALGKENQAMAGGKVGERLGNAIEDLRRSAFQVHNTIVNFRQYLAPRHLVSQLHVGFFKRPAEASHAVAVLADVFALGFVQDMQDCGPAITAGLDETDEILDQVLEENIVFPEGVVGVNQKRFAFHSPERTSSFKALVAGSKRRRISVAAPGHPRRSGAPRRAATWLLRPSSSPPTSRSLRAGWQSSRPRLGGCSSEWPHPLRASDR